jgi:hypothetical protein
LPWAVATKSSSRWSGASTNARSAACWRKLASNRSDLSSGFVVRAGAPLLADNGALPVQLLRAPGRGRYASAGEDVGDRERRATSRRACPRGPHPHLPRAPRTSLRRPRRAGVSGPCLDAVGGLPGRFAERGVAVARGGMGPARADGCCCGANRPCWGESLCPGEQGRLQSWRRSDFISRIRDRACDEP